MTDPWAPDSWRHRPTRQQPRYPDGEALARTLSELQALPPLVTSWEVEALKGRLAEAQAGERFLLQGGECAEAFSECRAPVIVARLKILLQMSLVLIYGLRKPVVRVGRFAGQYAKPRSNDHETRDGQTLPSYRGDIINAHPFEPEARTPDPGRMLRAHATSALTLNFVRGLIDGGFADLHHPEYWDLGFLDGSPQAEAYHQAVRRIREAIAFAELVAHAPLPSLERVECYTSHEALLLPYEEAFTRTVPHRSGHYNLSAHMPWIGLRTSDPDGAHVEYARGVANPIGLKVGPATSPSDLRRLVRRLDPEGTPGRLTLIHRFGADAIEAALPPLIAAVRAEGARVLWCSDPMHGNTIATRSGFKTRPFGRIMDELRLAFDIHEAEGSRLGGVHFELTGDNVTECIGGAEGLVEADLDRAYTSRVDPRLNAGQALEMALGIVHEVGEAGIRGVA